MAQGGKRIWTLTQPVYFIGFMGSGKSSVVRMLSRSCNLPSIDVDRYLELQEGRSISQIFASDGEDAFRLMETKYLCEISTQPAQLVSCGGGVVLRPENVEIMRASGFVMYLGVTADEAASRISDTSTRPLFNDLEAARERIAARMPLYEAAANLYIDTTGRDLEYIVRAAREQLAERGILAQQ